MEFPEIVRKLASGALPNCFVSRSGAATRVRLACALRNAGRNVVLVAKDAAELAEFSALSLLLTPKAQDCHTDVTLPAWEKPWILLPPNPAGGSARAAWATRMASFFALQRRVMPQGVIVTLDNFLPKLPPFSLLEQYHLHLHVGEEMAPDMVLEEAVRWGYVRSPMVSQAGEIALRGDILDIFAPGYCHPLRIEFFGDTIEDIRLFDASTQRSKAALQKITLLPTAPVIFASELLQNAKKFWDNLAKAKDIPASMPAKLYRAAEEGGAFLPGAYYEDAVFLEKWLPPEPIYILPQQADILELLQSSHSKWTGFLEKQEEERGAKQPENHVLRSAEAVQGLWNGAAHVHFEELTMGIERQGEDLPERPLHAFQDLVRDAAHQERPWQALIARLKELRGSMRQTILSFSTEHSRAKFLALAEQDGITPFVEYHPSTKGLYALLSPFRRGVELAWDNLIILGEDVLQPRTREQRVRSKAFSGLKGYDKLTTGSLLVHREYGIARFEGLERLELGGVTNDFLLLRYAGDDKLYLPVDRLSVIQQFKGQDGATPTLDKLGSASWTACKEKARKAIEKIANDLVEMYAWRKVEKGYSYSPLGEMYREFEASFGFEETPDQARAIEDVLHDMERPVPMDRLVCGDVGFGKTEVALRAAFRAALDGKQVALLCPTTVLAEQHYQTFRSRLANFPVNIGVLSRFVPRQKQKEVLAACERGQIDILVGTHRLLSNDVLLPNLGLLILDEEQRFGVRHKEMLKKMRRNVDVLTLTATPIPRTLQLSMSGIRELSVIETAPPERKPVATCLIERDKIALRGLVERELERGGQVFWVHNRVQGLENVGAYVRELVPTARVGMAHGQMTEKALEETMHQFWHGELDVLVCTAIVESGLDFPRANTLIVDQAQMFGLGQLYQLRGRVGRSDRQAYAVFVVSDTERLPELARKRMQIILEMDYLGAGFQVAMEDLRLRGAGNILGEVQSGHMARVGLDMYLQMLEEEVARLKGEVLKNTVETELNIGVTALIPERYIEDGIERLTYYKSLSSAQNDVEQEEIELEIRDRFGAFPVEVQDFFAILRFKRFLSGMEVQKADLFKDKVRFTWAENASRIAPVTLVAWVAERAKEARLIPPAILEYHLPMGDSYSVRLEKAKKILQALTL